MKLEELLEKVENDTIAKEHIFEYFQVKNIEGFELVFEDLAKNLKVSLEYINTSFPFIFTAREKENFNPIEEKFYYYSTVLPGLYGIEQKLINAIARAFGVFETILMFERIFKHKEEIKYYDSLYKNYVEHRQSLSTIAKAGLDKMSQFLDEKMDKLDMNDLRKLGKEIMGEFNNIVKEKS
jgi:hypothetical protein